MRCGVCPSSSSFVGWKSVVSINSTAFSVCKCRKTTDTPNYIPNNNNFRYFIHIMAFFRVQSFCGLGNGVLVGVPRSNILLRFFPTIFFHLVFCFSFSCARFLGVLSSFLVEKLVQICQRYRENRTDIRRIDRHRAERIAQLIVNSHCNHKQIQIVPLCERFLSACSFSL